MRARLCILLTVVGVLLSACSDGEPAPLAISAPATIKGIVTYDFVPAKVSGDVGFLDYADIQTRPARLLEVTASAGGETWSRAVTSLSGTYSMVVPGGRTYTVQARAIVPGSEGDQPTRVIGASSNVYTISRSILAISDEEVTLDLHATSGWNTSNSSYDAASRQAGPFAILDTIVTARQRMRSVDSSITYEALDVVWGPERSQGSFYQRSNNVHQLFINGMQDLDTDEYDRAVVAHEWVHYLLNSEAVDDNLGGSHGPNDLLDESVAYGEGLPTAMAGMLLETRFYIDTLGPDQGDGFYWDLEQNSRSNTEVAADDTSRLLAEGEELLYDGPYSEASVQELLWDLYDDNADKPEDTLSFGLAAFWAVLKDPRYQNTPYFISIATFLEVLKLRNETRRSAITALAATENIMGDGDMFPSGLVTGNRYTTLLPNGQVIVNDAAGRPLQTYLDFDPDNSQQYGAGFGFYERQLFIIPNLPIGTYRLTVTPTGGNSVVSMIGFPEVLNDTLQTGDNVEERIDFEVIEAGSFGVAVEGVEEEITFTIQLVETSAAN